MLEVKNEGSHFVEKCEVNGELEAIWHPTAVRIVAVILCLHLSFNVQIFFTSKKRYQFEFLWDWFSLDTFWIRIAEISKNLERFLINKFRRGSHTLNCIKTVIHEWFWVFLNDPSTRAKFQLMNDNLFVS